MGRDGIGAEKQRTCPEFKVVSDCQSVIRILLCEDSVCEAEMILQVFEQVSQACEVTRTDSLAGVQHRLNVGDVDILITGGHLQGGFFEGVMKLAQVIAPQLPVIVVSGQSRDEELSSAPGNGACEFVSRSDLNRLPAEICRELNRTRLAAGNRRGTSDIHRNTDLTERAFTASEDAILLLENGLICDGNRAAVQLIRCSEVSELIGASPLKFSAELQDDGVGSALRWNQQLKLVAARAFCRFDWAIQTQDGEPVPVKVTLSPTVQSGRSLLQVTLIDMSELLTLKEARNHAVEEEQLQMKLLQLSFRCRELWEFLRGALELIVSRTWLQLQQHGAVYLVEDEEPSVMRLVGDYQLPTAVWERCASLEFQGERYPLRPRCGLRAPYECYAPAEVPGMGDEVLRGYLKFPLRDGELLGILCLAVEPGRQLCAASRTVLTHIASQISLMVKRFQMEQRIQYQATHDELTGLPNRRLLIEWAKEWWPRAQHPGKQRLVLLLDIYNLKQINYSLGRRTGSLLLNEIGRRLNEALDVGEFVAHLSGDLFCMVSDVSPVAGTGHQRQVEKIRRLLSRPFAIEGHELYVSYNIGGAWEPSQGGAEGLLKRAEMALHKSIGGGYGCVQLYEPHMAEEAMERLSLENDLRHALERNELELHFQPQVAPDSGEIQGAEALLRWKHPDKGWISPALFVPIAEESGLIYSIGDWVLQEACRIARSWEETAVGAIPVAVNISAMQFHLVDFVDRIATALEQSGLDSTRLELEVTESVAMEKVEGVVATLCQLEAMGVKLAIDDFGTGFCSLTYLQEFPLSKLKIDRDFVKNLGKGDDGSVARFIMFLADSKNLKTVIEGVESESQLAFFSRLSCDLVQGFYYSSPLPAEEFSALLQAPTAFLPFTPAEVG